MGILHLCKKLCKIDQYFLGVISGSFKDSPQREKYLDLTSFMALLHLEAMSSVIRQKGESQKRCFKKTKHAKFSGKRTFLTP